MMLSLVLLCAAATAMVTFGSSAVVGVGLAAFRTGLDRLAPGAQARVLLAAALLPAIASLAVMTAALAPSFGWIVDHCTSSVDPHAHPHICAAHHQAAFPAASVVAIAAVLFIRILVMSIRLARAAATSVLTGRALGRVSAEEVVAGARVLPLDEPQAFVVGLARPLLFVTRGLLSAEHREHLDAVLAHERAHLRRRDAVRRLIAFIALPFHLPGIAAWLERRLGQAHEMAADAEAARVVRSPERVAQALVRLARASLCVPQAALAFGGSDVEARVTMLLDARPRLNRPGPLALYTLAVVGIAVVGASADAVHHGVEVLLGMLGG